MYISKNIPISKIKIPKHRRNVCRGEFYDHLLNDIREKGQLNRILVQQQGTKYLLEDGLVRLTILKELGLESIEAMVIND